MARWQTVTFSQNGGSGGETRTLYFYDDDYGTYQWYLSKSTGGTQVSTIKAIPTRLGYTFGGYYVEDSSTSHTCSVADSDGNLTKGLAWFTSSGSRTATALWSLTAPQAVINLNDGETAGTEILYYDSSTSKWYFDYPFTTEFSSSNPITIPARGNHRFTGCYSSTSGGTLYINADGTPTAAFLALAPTGRITIYAQWERSAYSVTIKHDDGDPTSSKIYYGVADGKWYSEYLCVNEITSITPPVREYYRWDGAFSSSTHSEANRYIYSDGTFASKLTSLTLTANLTISEANSWTAVSHSVKLQGTDWYYVQETYYVAIDGSGCFADSLCETTPLTYLPVPVRAGYRFTGFYSNSGLSQYTDEDGLIDQTYFDGDEALKLYPHGVAATATLTLYDNGGTGGDGTIYFESTNSKWFNASSQTITGVSVPTRTGGYVFQGYYSGSTQMIAADGTIGSVAPTASATLTARWVHVDATINVNRGSGSGGTSVFYYNGADGLFYSDSAHTSQITSVALPSLACHTCNGLYDSDSVQIVNSSGVIDSSWIPAASAITLTATYTRTCYKLTLDHNGGTSSTSAIYRAAGGSAWYSSESLSTQISSVSVPTYTGYTFGGYSYNSTVVIGSMGSILSAAAVNADYTATASWTIKKFTITFNANGGACSESSRDVQEGQPIGDLPTPTRTGYTFDGWYDAETGGNAISSSTVVIAADTYYAHWTIISYAINYILNGGTNHASNPSSYTVNDSVTLQDPTRTGYVFAGWTPTGSIPSGSVGERTFTATWTQIIYIAKPTAASGLVYNGSAQTGVTFDSSLSYTGDVSATNADSYSATFTLPADTSSSVYRWSDGTTGTMTVSWSISALAVTSASVTFDSIPDQLYTGSAIEPTVTMYFGGAAKTRNTDYTVAYSDNTAVGTATATVTGIGNFSGTKALSFNIVKETVQIQKPTAVSGLVYDGSAQTGVTYDSRLTSSGTTSATNAGSYTATFSLPSETAYFIYQWTDGTTASVAVSWSISHLAVSDSSVAFDSIPDQPYTGSAIRPTVTMYFDGAVKTLNTDYSVTYSNNVNVGTNTATATVTGLGNFTGTKALKFSIVAGTVYIEKPSALSPTYNGTNQTGVNYDSRLTASGTYAATNAGTYTATFALPSNTTTVAYKWSDGSTGSVSVSWTMGSLALSDSSIIYAVISDQTYTGSAITPSITATVGSVSLVSGTDYTATYANNTNVGQATVTLTGKGNFTGTKTIYFNIVAGTSTIAIPTAITGLVYNGNSQTGVSYDSRLSASGASATAAGDHTATFSLPSSTSTTTYKWSDGTTASKSVQWTISPLAVSSSSVTFAAIDDQAYTGSAITPSVTMTFNGSVKTQGTDYTLSYSNNVNVGTATATVTGIGNFTGTKALTFNIVKGTISIATPTALSPTYNGSAQTGVSYDSRLSVSGTASATAAGQYTATFSLPSATSTSTYKWSDGTTAIKSVSWYLAPLVLTSSSVAFDSIPAQTYTGSAIRPTVSATFNGTALVQGTDFSATYSNNTAVGTATVTCAGTGNFTGTKALTFQIVAPESRVVTFDGNGGTPSEPSRTVTDGSQIGTLPTATRTGYDLLGWYTASTGGTAIDSTRTITSNVTFYAHWQTISYTISYVLNGGTNAASNPSTYTVEQSVTLAAPTRDDYTFTGWSPNGGVIPVGSTGAKTFTASWTSATICTVTFDACGGYCSEVTRGIPEGETVGTLPTPTYTGYTFGGWWTAASGGTRVYSSTTVDEDVTYYAHWTANSYTLYFDANGGTTSTSSKTVTFGSAIGTLPTPTYSGHTFGFWELNGVEITSATTWSYSSNMTAYAEWDVSFGRVTDYFNLGSANLIPESSDSGDTHEHTCAYNATSESPATETSGIWRNPRVTYRVVGQMTLNITLGAAFPGVVAGTNPNYYMTQSGYMISAVEIHTAVGEAPTVTVTGVANEGHLPTGSTWYARPTPAVKTYSVSIAISPRHRPQNLLSAISGGGELQELTLVARGDPVVVAENGMPCASDMTHGRIEVTATTAAYNNESAPTAGTNFTKTAEPVAHSGTGYKTFSVTVRKELT